MRKIFAWCVDHPYWTIGISILLTLAFICPVPKLQTETDFRKFLSQNDPIRKLLDQAEQRYGRAIGITIGVINEEQGIFNPATLTKIHQIEQSIKSIPGVKTVTSPLSAQVITGTQTAITVQSASPGGKIPETEDELEAFRKRMLESPRFRGYLVSEDGKAAMIAIKLAVGADEAKITDRIIEIVGSLGEGHEQIVIFGDNYVDRIVSQEMAQDLQLLFLVAVVMIVAVLYISLRALRGILIPLLVVIPSIIIGLGIMALLGFPMTMVSFIFPVLILAIGIADGIHILNRYNEETKKNLPKRQAILNTLDEMKGPVIMTSLTTAAGFLSLTSSFLLPQKHFGVITSIGILAAMCLSLTLIPALLSLFKVPRSRNTKLKTWSLTPMLKWIGKTAVLHPTAVILSAAVIVGAMLAGLPFLRVETSNEDMLGKNHPVMQIVKVFDTYFPGTMQIQIEIDTGKPNGLKDPRVLKKMVELEKFLVSKGIRKTLSLASLVREMNQKFHSDDPSYYRIPEDARLVSQLLLLFTFQGGKLEDMALGDFSAGTATGFYPLPTSQEASRLAREVQTYLDKEFNQEGIRAHLVGTTMLWDQMTSRITESQFVGLGTAAAAAGLLVMLLMGSVVAGLLALIPLAVTIATSFGIMAYSGTALDIMTLMVSSVSIGIGIDYSIHFMTRFRNEYHRTLHPERACYKTLTTTGRAIVYNALTVALGFLVLVFASFKAVRMFGLQVTITMLLSSLSALILLPTILVHWQPKFLKRGFSFREKPH